MEQQQQQSTEIFIAEIRAPFAELQRETCLTEEVQIDMMYGFVE